RLPQHYSLCAAFHQGAEARLRFPHAGVGFVEGPESGLSLLLIQGPPIVRRRWDVRSEGDLVGTVQIHAYPIAKNRPLRNGTIAIDILVSRGTPIWALQIGKSPGASLKDETGQKLA